MNRRTFISSVGAVMSAPFIHRVIQPQSAARSLIKPLHLKPGDVVGAITPSTPISDPDRLALVERTLRHFGLKTKWGRHVGKRSGYFGSPVEDRLDDLHAMFRDPEVKAVFCIGGGYGTQHLLDKLDYDLIRRHPKIFLGYSDITALHLAIHQNTNLVTFHGPVILSKFSDYTQQHFRRAIFETKPLGLVTNPPDNNALRPEHRLRAIRPGTASGPLIGGNLTLISTLMGTPYEPETRGKIFFIEDIGEEPYRIDRMLTQLRLAGKFEAAAGVIFGECTDCGPNDYKPSLGSNFSLGEVLDNVLGDLKVPVLAGLTIGHTADQLTLPLGVMATLNADQGTVEIREAGVS